MTSQSFLRSFRKPGVKPEAGLSASVCGARGIKRGPQLRRVREAGRILQGGCFRISVLNNVDGVSRASFFISKRVVKQAAARNRLKRLMREFYRSRRPLIRDGWDLVFEVSRAPKVLRWRYDSVEKQLDPLLKEAEMVRAS